MTATETPVPPTAERGRLVRYVPVIRPGDIGHPAALRKRCHALDQHRQLVASGDVSVMPDAAYWLRMALRYGIAARPV